MKASTMKKTCERCGAELGHATITERAKNKRGKPLPPVNVPPPAFCSRACKNGESPEEAAPLPPEETPKAAAQPVPVVEPANLA